MKSLFLVPLLSFHLLSCVIPPDPPSRNESNENSDTATTIIPTLELPEDTVESIIAPTKVEENSKTVHNFPEQLKDEESLAQGKDIYLKICAACHGSGGSGSIAPSLIDKTQIQANRMEAVYQATFYGSSKGMPSFARILSPKDLQRVSSYVLSLADTN